jgi:quercetin dioxygenase-like cupin family protein
MVRSLGVAVCAALAAIALGGTSPLDAQAQSLAGKKFASPGGSVLKVITDAAVLGGSEAEIVEITLPPNSDSGDHQHGVTETFYVLEGDMQQVINGKPVSLTPGMAASIRSTDHVQHKAGPKGAKVLVIWAPGGEIARVTARWKPQADR